MMNYEAAPARLAGGRPTERFEPAARRLVSLVRPAKRLAAPVALVVIWYVLCTDGLLPRHWLAVGSTVCAGGGLTGTVGGPPGLPPAP